MNKFLLVLVALCFSLSFAIAGESAVVVDGVQYRQSDQSVVLVPGEVRRVDMICETVNKGFDRTTTCTWSKTVTATAGGIVVTDGASSITTGARNEMVFASLAIGIMMIAVVLMCAGFSHASFITLAFAALVAALVLTTAPPASSSATGVLLVVTGALIVAAAGALIVAADFLHSIADENKKMFYLLVVGVLMSVMALVIAGAW